MKAEIKCVSCGEVLGNWEKAEFSEEDRKFVSDGFLCACGSPASLVEPSKEEQL